MADLEEVEGFGERGEEEKKKGKERKRKRKEKEKSLIESPLSVLPLLRLLRSLHDGPRFLQILLSFFASLS